MSVFATRFRLEREKDLCYKTDHLDMTSAVYSGRKANKILHFLKAICSDVRAFTDVLSFDVYKKTTDLNPLVTNGCSGRYHLDESTFIFRDFRSNFSFSFIFR